MTHNPFDVQTPENLSTSDMSDLFVQSDSDYLQVEKAGHTFISGPRGAGKSMYFRFLEPDCQCQRHELPLKDLGFYAAYIPIKETDLNLPELFRLQETKHAAIVLNEHALVLHIATKIFVSLKARAPLPNNDKVADLEFNKFCDETLRSLLIRSGFGTLEPAIQPAPTIAETIDRIIAIFDEIFSELNSYTRRITFAAGVVPYDGPLFGFTDFLSPLVRALLNLSFMPKGPLFLLIDDADNLNEEQAMILNSWVARRTTGYLCFKISVQEGEYKSYKAVGGQRIDAPHDYSEFNISDKYTTRSDNYKKRATEIIQRRLHKFNLTGTPHQFFPENEKQEERIKAIAADLIARWEKEGKGFRPNDDAIRYARPNYIRSLSQGGRKSGSTYSYAGFDQLVHLSSGVVRHLLELSSQMFAEAIAKNNNQRIEFIPHSIQDQVAEYYSDWLLFDGIRKLQDEYNKKEIEAGIENDRLDDPKKLKNLIFALGGMFRTILMSDASERRVFSIAFSNGPDEEVSRILRLGVKQGYLHRSSIGNKEGTGRSELYIMTRALAPSFKLDPTSFAGYKFVTNGKIKRALYQPNRLVSEVNIKGFDEVMSESAQGGLFDEQ
ncbi:hypothetical protein [Martelella limonii]|uniref:ORC-CDC6 family AAA ATPase n=1 Tax=Martelella limonii TaxID=1647649 RepID=UPI00158086CD|nr:hypothetical protein [Martelella limonii]